jgi:DNA mismatch repair protein MutS2
MRIPFAFLQSKNHRLKEDLLEILEQRLGFDQIKEWIANACRGDLGRKMALNLKWLRHYETIVLHQEQAEECRKLFSEGIYFPDANFFDLKPLTDQLEIEGYVLLGDQWSVLSRALKTVDQTLKILRSVRNRFERLSQLGQKVEIPQEIFFHIEQVFTEDGDIKDTASSELNRLRKKRIDEQSRLRRKLESILKSTISQGFTNEDSSITIRNGRLVIPLLAEYKRRIKGFVHDESATGQTVFLEPEEAIELNNEIREIEFAEKREIHRILTELTSAIRPHRKAIESASQFLGIIDLVRAKALFASAIQAQLPGHHAVPTFKLFEARHPLLFLSHQKSKKPIVPLTIWLTEEKRVLVISGPNAGGKSICLKTVGLLQYMWQSGVPVSAGEGSTMGFFEKIMVDIGDQQSIENDLSTYSSHLTNMRNMLREANAKTLILIDEFGTGTDPALGGPIAEAILEGLCHKKIFGLVNTHYTNLKNFAHRHPAIENGAMKFDMEKMEPLFQLEIGQPGSSFALEIAEKIGLPNAILNQAKNKIGVKKINVDKLIAELETEKKKWESKNQELSNREKKTKIIQNEWEKKHLEFENQRKKILNEAKQKAAKLLEDSNKRIEETIRQIRESQAEKEQTKVLRQNLESLKVELVPEEIISKPEEKDKSDSSSQAKIEVVAGEIEPGDFVRIKGTDSIGQMMGFKGKDAEVIMGDIRTNLKINRLEKISGFNPKENSNHKRTTQNLNINQKMMNFESTLDVRGLRTDEAISLVENWLDEAILLGQKELKIIHGKGDGILRTQLRNHLKKFKQVSRMADEHADMGGQGITLVSLDV